jgi:hypothetical protein
MASGTLPSNEKNVTRTGRVFCNMKMTKTINRTAAIQIPTQTAQRANVVSRDRSRNTGLRGGGRGCRAVICGLVDRLLGGHHGLLYG